MPSSREFNVPLVIFPNPSPQQRRAPSSPFQSQTMPQSRPPNHNPNPNLPFMSFDMSSASTSSYFLVPSMETLCLKIICLSLKSTPLSYLLLVGLFQLLVGKLHSGIILGWISVSACFIYVAFNSTQDFYPLIVKHA
ncbi:hypothetical protein AMTRI_Chr03g138990 [Amborella trichopoda]